MGHELIIIEIETYSDLFARPTIAKPQEDRLDPVKLKMDERFFPPSLWDAYFAPEKETKRVKSKAGRESLSLLSTAMHSRAIYALLKSDR